MNELCVDTECIMFLIDRVYLMKILSLIKIHHADVAIKVRDIETATHNCFEYVHLKLFIPDFKEIAKLFRQAHVVNNLRAKFFMSMNILKSEEIILDISRRRMILSLCENLKIVIRVTSKLESRINRVIFAERLIIISSKSVVSVSIKMKESLFDRDYLFQSISRELNLERIEEIMIHMIDVNVVAVQIINSTNKSVIISRKIRLDRLIEYEEHDCYSINAAEASLAAESF